MLTELPGRRASVCAPKRGEADTPGKAFLLCGILQLLHADTGSRRDRVRQERGVPFRKIIELLELCGFAIALVRAYGLYE